ncbi:Glycosyltransferase family 1 protein [Stenotrophomonas geniculata]|uniref:glycosyltransferase family 4 protein n=1 Tax=Stenotrophomonas geniculata TaxID=86188 RepID=UPI00374BDDA2
MNGSRILFVCTQMEAGGVQRRSTAMCGALRSKGLDCRVIFLYRKRGAYDDLDFCKSLLPAKPRGPADLCKAVFRLFKEIRAHRPTAVVGMAHYSSPLASIAAALAGVPNRVATQTNPPGSVPLIGRALDLLCGVAGIYTSNICASESIEAEFSRYPERYRKTLRTVVNGVDPSPSMPPETASYTALRDRLAKSARPVIMNCGRLSKQKNQSFLIDCMRDLDANLVIVGEGELRQEIEARISQLGLEGKVILVGEVPPSQVGAYLALGDIFAFPSHFEAFGLVAVEAMRAGLPLVCSDHPALREVVGDAGILLPPTDRNSWVKTLSELACDPPRMALLSEKGADRAQLFSFDRMLHGFEEEMSKISTEAVSSQE